jgi:hypothetical protein
MQIYANWLCIIRSQFMNINDGAKRRYSQRTDDNDGYGCPYCSQCLLKKHANSGLPIYYLHISDITRKIGRFPSPERQPPTSSWILAVTNESKLYQTISHDSASFARRRQRTIAYLSCRSQSYFFASWRRSFFDDSFDRSASFTIPTQTKPIIDKNKLNCFK